MMTQQIERHQIGSVRPELPYVELTGFEDLRDEERDIQHAMHKFARGVRRPAGIAIDNRSAEEATAPESPYWEFVATGAASGIEFDATADDIPPQALARIQAIVIE